MSQFISPILVLTSLFGFACFSRTRALQENKPACLEILVGGRLDGSGSIVCSSGLVLTACHVIRKRNKKYELSPSTWEEATKSVATYRGSDLALLRLPKSIRLTRTVFGQIHPRRRKTGVSAWFSHIPPSPYFERNHRQKANPFPGSTAVSPIPYRSAGSGPRFIRRSLGESERRDNRSPGCKRYH